MKRTIAVTPATDPAAMASLLPVMEAHRDEFDEWRWWPVGEEASLPALTALAEGRSWIHIERLAPSMRQDRSRYYRLCHSTLPRAVFVLVDERTSWLSHGFFAVLAEEARGNRVFAAHAVVVAQPTTELGDAPPCAVTHEDVPELSCYAWAGLTFSKFSGRFRAGQTERTEILEHWPTVTRRTNVVSSRAACIVRASGPAGCCDAAIEADVAEPAQTAEEPAEALPAPPVVELEAPPEAPLEAPLEAPPEAMTAAEAPPEAMTAAEAPSEGPQTPLEAAPQAPQAPPPAPKKRRVSKRGPRAAVVDI